MEKENYLKNGEILSEFVIYKILSVHMWKEEVV